eukprot:6821340-Pyramimonas_sp.AAC.1
MTEAARLMAQSASTCPNGRRVPHLDCSANRMVRTCASMIFTALSTCPSAAWSPTGDSSEM